MKTSRLEAFSDGVLAIILTIMVLEMKVPKVGDDETATLNDLIPLWPVFLSYLLSFVYVGIYWNNHHHMLQATQRVTAGAMWANLHLLFWLSLVPFVTAWMGQNHFDPAPTALYGFVMLMAAVAYFILLRTILASEEPDSVLRRATGSDVKGKLSLALYAVAIPVAYVLTWLSGALYVAVAVMWLIPERKIEEELEENPPGEEAVTPGG